MGVSVYTLSLMARQRLFLQDRFAQRFPGWWLVWEPGPWRPALSRHEGDTASTQLDGESSARPEGDDAFCYQLPGGPCSLLLGRESSCDLYLNDLTLSREHLRLHGDGSAWSVEALEHATAPTILEGAALPKGTRVPLVSGATLQAGEVLLRLASPGDFLARLAVNAAR